MNRLRWGVALSGWVALAATALPEAFPLRVAIPAVFLLCCPGLATTLLCTGQAVGRDKAGRAAVLESAVLTGTISLALSALVAQALFLSNTFSPGRALLVLAVLTSAAALAPVLSRVKAAVPRRAKPSAPSPERSTW
jgi:hypothetical protein